MTIIAPLLAVLSIWDYPARQPEHERLRGEFIVAMREKDATSMTEACRAGVELFPDDPTWRYNLACSLAWSTNHVDEALNELEKAIDLGFRNADEIAADADLKRLAGVTRYAALIDYAREMSKRPIVFGPLATVDATGPTGSPVALGEQNLGWDFDSGCFLARMKLSPSGDGAWVGDLYMNRDAGHSVMKLAEFPGITEVRFDLEGHRRGLDINMPNVIFPYPTFGNCSMALVNGPFWRSIPRAMMTIDAGKLRLMEKLYLSNQIWVYPSNADTPPIGTSGDVFASITPYWITTAGRSWSDRPYLRAALLASGAFQKEVKAEIVRRRLLAPTIMTLIRKHLHVVTSEEEYLTSRAHPTAMPKDGVNISGLVAAARKLTVKEIPPVVPIFVAAQPPSKLPAWPELTYRTSFAWAFVLRADDVARVFTIRAGGAKEFRFVQTHGRDVDVKIEQLRPNEARLTINRANMSPTNRVDIAVFGRNEGTGWGAPSYVSFARMDPSAPYSDPVLTRSGAPAAK